MNFMKIEFRRQLSIRIDKHVSWNDQSTKRWKSQRGKTTGAEIFCPCRWNRLELFSEYLPGERPHRQRQNPSSRRLYPKQIGFRSQLRRNPWICFGKPTTNQSGRGIDKLPDCRVRQGKRRWQEDFLPAVMAKNRPRSGFWRSIARQDGICLQALTMSYSKYRNLK